MDILVIRSASRIFHKTVKQLKREFPGAAITVIATEDARSELEQDVDISTLVTLSSTGRMKLRHLGLTRLLALRKKGFELGVSLYNYESGVGYSNIDFMVWAIAPERHRGYNVYGQYLEGTKKGLIGRLLREKGSFLFIVLNSVFTILLFVLITIGILFEWLTRRVSKSPGR